MPRVKFTCSPRMFANKAGAFRVATDHFVCLPGNGSLVHPTLLAMRPLPFGSRGAMHLGSWCIITLPLLLKLTVGASPLGAQGGPPPFMGVVSPKGAAQSIDLSTGDRTLNFTIFNTGAQAGGGYFTVNCTGPFTGCTSSPGSVFTSGSVPVTVHYHSTGVAGTGRVALVFNPQQAPYNPDSGWFNITAAPPPPPSISIVVTPTPASVTLPGGRTDQWVAYTVQNTGSTDTRVLLRGTCSGAPLVAVCTSTMSEVYVHAGETVPARVNVTTMPSAGSGSSLYLIASNPATGADLVSGVVAVSTTAPPAAIVTVKTFQAGPNVDKSLCPVFAAVPGVDSQCGSIRIVHPLPSVRTYGKTYTPTLAYYQDNTEGLFLLVDVALAPSTPVPEQVQVNAYTFANGVRGALAVTKTVPGATWAATRAQRINLRDMAGPSYQLDKYEIEVRFYANGAWTTVAPSVWGEVIPVVRRAGYQGRTEWTLGNGWGLLGLEELVPNQPDGIVTWIGGDGSTRKYTPAPAQPIPGTVVFTTVNYFRPDTLYWLPDGTFRMPLPHGAAVYFDALGRHTSTKDRHGRSTFFGYDQPGSKTLSTITVPGNFTYTFSYSPSELTITAPGSRVVHVHRVGTSYGINDIVDPDGTTETFAYPAWGPDYAIIGYMSKRGTYTELSWEGWGKTLSGPYTVVPGFPARVSSQMVTALGRGAPPTDGAVDVGLPDYDYDGSRVEVSDLVKIWTDSMGAITRTIDATGKVTTIEHGDPRFPGLATRVINGANGYETRAGYDARGHVAATTTINPHEDGKDATTVYAWNATWDEVTKITTAEGVVSAFGVDTITGNRLWQENPNLAGSRTVFDYNADQQLQAIHAPTIASATPTTTIGYTSDGLHNPASVTSPKGYLTRYSVDGLGRTTATAQQIIPGDVVTMQLDSTVYDVMDRVTEELHYGPALTNGGNAPTAVNYLRVYHDYYPNGDLSAIRRYPLNGPIGLLTTGYRYDALGRLIAEVATDGLVDSTAYDEAGNVKAHVTRNVDILNVTYDALNRPLTKTMPAKSYAARPAGICSNVSCPDSPNPTYPQYDLSSAGHLTVAGETSTFTYDPATGAVQTANNPAAAITRSYYRNGDLKTEEQHLRTVAGTIDANVHDYTLTYLYDRDGRPTTLQLPAVLQPTTVAGAVLGTSIGYTYDPNTGALKTVRDAMGNVSTAQYNVRGELFQTAFPGVSRTESFDDDGQLSSSVVQVVNGGAVFRNSTLTYDARGKMLTMTGTAGANETISSWYSGLGQVVRNTSHSVYFVGCCQTFDTDESFNVSALGDMISGTTGSSYQYLGGGGFGATGSNNGTMSRTYDYNATSGRLVGQSEGGRSDTFAYDSAGNTTFMSAQGSSQTPTWEQRASFYDASGQLRVTELRSVTNLTELSGRNFHQAVEEYSYDALGRRVLVRARKVCDDPNDAFCMVGTVRRTIWDGSAELAEIQQPGSDTASAATMESDGALVARQSVPAGDAHDPNPFFGIAVYAYGLNGTDQPVTVTRLHYHVWTSTLNDPFDPYAITPFWSPMGQVDGGVFADGALSHTSQGRGVQIQFPNGWFAYYRSRYVPQSWHGSLIEDKRDASGLHYRRNRSYDPMTGRFTQEDPIGLAGGMNAYGFAGGDPVTYSDPFGLCPVTKEDPTPCPDPVGQMIADVNAGMANAVAGVSNAVLEATAGLINAVTGVGDVLTAAGLNPNVQGSGGRAMAGVAAASAFVMTPAGAEGAHIGITEGKAALASLMSGDVRVMAGAGTDVEYRAAAGLGGNAADWQYRTSRATLAINGYKWQAHWAYNIATGESALAKIKAVGFIR
jgi:RHS repeat-associated protein